MVIKLQWCKLSHHEEVYENCIGGGTRSINILNWTIGSAGNYRYLAINNHMEVYVNISAVKRKLINHIKKLN